MSRFAKPAHKSAARMLGYALTLNDFDTWAGLALVLRARLDTTERAALAYMALRSLDEADAIATSEAALAEFRRLA